MNKNLMIFLSAFVIGTIIFATLVYSEVLQSGLIIQDVQQTKKEISQHCLSLPLSLTKDQIQERVKESVNLEFENVKNIEITLISLEQDNLYVCADVTHEEVIIQKEIESNPTLDELYIEKYDSSKDIWISPTKEIKEITIEEPLIEGGV